jgi:diaminohydroxyphosphoribosylaminopyrimidine deaminase / 5-amino-6-(5-phosphoribosylamino)uracil reductase
MTVSGSDVRFMTRALALAERGRYHCAPNPMVGAVVVRGGHVVGEGYHRSAGQPHAEILALRRAGARAAGATLYLTLEPCVHRGRTPPCAPVVISAGLTRVVVAVGDPDPRVSGRGIAALRKAGIPVAVGLMASEAIRQNERFRRWARSGRPFVLAKAAATLDGKIASAASQSRYISGPEARRAAMRLREEYDAVIVGVDTVRADDPRLTRRLGLNPGRRHYRLVLDGWLRMPDEARLLRRPEGVIVVTARSPGTLRVRRLVGRGVEVWSLPGPSPGRVDLSRLLRRLARLGVNGLLVEGGGETLWSFLSARLVDRLAIFLAPKLLGGRTAPTLLEGPGFTLARARELSRVDVEPLGRDLLLTGILTEPV